MKFHSSRVSSRIPTNGSLPAVSVYVKRLSRNPSSWNERFQFRITLSFPIAFLDGQVLHNLLGVQEVPSQFVQCEPTENLSRE